LSFIVLVNRQVKRNLAFGPDRANSLATMLANAPEAMDGAGAVP
jgi:hypothetical protein